MQKKLPIQCPSCSNSLKVQSLHCENCETTISGLFELPVLLQLEPQEQKFILDFVKSSGRLKEMAVKLKLSYPTVRNMLDDLINKLNQLHHED
ncbi:MAG: DUF2089 domain-containing protein [Carboxylicivirga sp.]|jgi:hypothetical protein|nr:DUF2089 domain-containing protein [Carboxylicivirga sp.]MCT4647902.1 DUF2089 domain-containing protein [Carboxylicivirga sp.]